MESSARRLTLTSPSPLRTIRSSSPVLPTSLVTAQCTVFTALVGVGYRVSLIGKNLLSFSLGYSHDIQLMLPAEVTAEVPDVKKGENPVLVLKSCDKQLIGQVAAKVRSFRKPEPYKGKGIKFVGEQLRRKAGKTAGAK